MPDLEFTGERVVEGLVDPNLFNEHVSRYRFAARYTAGKKVLDAGCGSGYGVQHLANAARIVGVDQALDAVLHARTHFGGASVQFVQSRCEALPFAEGSFDVVTAFEVIEHLGDWQALLTEARRVLHPEGVLLVSTPNKAYYAETRAKAGPNPFHVHEFEFDEFASALGSVFPAVQIWSQNHAASIAFTSPGEEQGDLFAAPDADASQAHFFVAACSCAALPPSAPFAWIPQSGNALRERERHIALLAQEVAQKSAWLKELEDRHTLLRDQHESVLGELRRSNHWAEGLRTELEAAARVVEERDAELRSRDQWVASLQSELTNATSHLRRLETELLQAHEGYRARETERTAEVAALHHAYGERVASLEREMASLHTGYEAVIADLQHTCEGLSAASQSAQAQLATVRESRWIRLGRTVGVGPRIE